MKLFKNPGMSLSTSELIWIVSKLIRVLSSFSCCRSQQLITPEMTDVTLACWSLAKKNLKRKAENFQVGGIFGCLGEVGLAVNIENNTLNFFEMKQD